MIDRVIFKMQSILNAYVWQINAFNSQHWYNAMQLALPIR